MDPANPYEPPHADLIHPEQEQGPSDVPLVPWEDRTRIPGFLDRILATAALMFRPAQAGPSLGLHRRVGPAATYFAWVGLPLVWAVQILAAVVGPADPMAGIMELLGLPHQAPPPEMASFQRTIQVAVSLFFPVSMALGMAMIGFVSHAGLWLVRALKPGRGLEATFRTLLYGYGTFNGILWIFNGWVFLPPILGMVVLGVSTLLSLAFFIQAGVLLARAHGTEAWRGVLGILLPWVLFVCCCGLFIGALGGFAAAMARAR
jgi:hypothetical protein